MARYFLGLISGTSVDGVDAALCDFGERTCRIVAAKTFAYPPAIERRVQTLIGAGEARLAEIGALDVAVGRFFADCALALIHQSQIEPQDVEAIGHHGQTIWHEPNPPEPFSWQIGDPNSVAAITGIDTVADLRRLDMAVGGQGAPLASGFHAFAFASDETPRVVVNIGGIANLTQLAPGRDVLGFDCGPGNTLLDSWAAARLGTPFDDGGRWAASGRPDEGLLDALLDEPYFSQPAPKSTGRERFNETWLKQKLGKIGREIADADVAATLLELTARTIVDAAAGLRLGNAEILVCGGGAKNGALLERIGALSGREPSTTAELGIDPDWVEAAMMAWLARARVDRTAGNMPTVTAAREARVLGGLYSGSALEKD